MVENLGTIAGSGSKRFIEELGSKNQSGEVIENMIG